MRVVVGKDQTFEALSLPYYITRNALPLCGQEVGQTMNRLDDSSVDTDFLRALRNRACCSIIIARSPRVGKK